jgi:transposase-like protein
MKASAFKKLLEQVALLSKRQREQLLQMLRSTAGLERFTEVIEQAKPTPTCCPTCGASQFHRHGRTHGLQRYRCRSCGRTFTALTGTPLAGLRHKEKWLDFLGSVLQSTTVRSAARSVGVHRNTSFRWRHRFLELTKHDRPDTLAGIAEADELYLLESHKGSRKLLRPPRKHGGAATKRGISNEQVCVLVARDRTGQTFDFVTGLGPVTKHQLRQHLLPVLDKDVLLVSDSNAAYRFFAREAGISHQAVNLWAGERVRGAVHVQNVNAYHHRFREWLARFHGVATRYLGNYLGWRWALDGNRLNSPDALLRAAIGIFNTQR